MMMVPKMMRASHTMLPIFPGIGLSFCALVKSTQTTCIPFLDRNGWKKVDFPL